MNSANGNNGSNENDDLVGGQNSSSSNMRTNNGMNSMNGMNRKNGMNNTRKNGNMAGGKRSNNNNGNGNLNGGAKIPAKGTKAQVYHGTARHTSGGLTKKDLMKTKKGRIVSRKKHAAGKKALKNLVKAGYKAKKGTFKLFKK